MPKGRRKRRSNIELCCCCGFAVATEPNGLCKDCAENCAGYLLKDKPCITIEKKVMWVLKKDRTCKNCGAIFPKGSSAGKFLRHVQSCGRKEAEP
jgi:hypothetical protein